ncbi:MAG: methyltransferase domain-containing protein [Pseudomonadales bacterium]|nr:methyltransferase domain-containing protein [Pseudomonadales bacterium]
MTAWVFRLLLLVSLGLVSLAQAATEAPGYQFSPADFDGIGKRYLGRSIAHVMGHRGAGWLERPSRQDEERTDLLIESLPLSEDSVVADIGAGTGYFAFPVAQRVPRGKVLAVDIQQEMLELIDQRKHREGADNIALVEGSIDGINLPPDSIDLAYIVDAYHEFSHPFEMGRSIFEALKPGGQLVLIEYRAEDDAVPIKRLHKMTARQVNKEMQVLGFELTKSIDVLPQQHFMVFTKPQAL